MKIKSMLVTAIAMTAITSSFAQGIGMPYGPPVTLRPLSGIKPYAPRKSLTADQQKINNDSNAYLAAKRKYCSDNMPSSGQLCGNFIDRYQLDKTVEQNLLSLYPKAYTSSSSFSSWKTFNGIY